MAYQPRLLTVTFSVDLPRAMSNRGPHSSPRTYFRRAGMSDRLLHRTGHGMDVTGREAPFFADGYERLIEPGMCLIIEPGIYVEGIGGFRHSDTVLIGDDGPVKLTGGPVSIGALTLPMHS